MKPPRTLVATALALPLLAAKPAVAEPVTYVLDPARSFVQFELLHFNTSTIRGRIGPAAGSVTLDRAAGGGQASVRIPTATVSTGVRVFDARIREPDLLATTEFPEAFFVATQLRFEGDRVAELRGEFTLRGVSQPLSLKALHFGCRDGRPPDTPQVCGGDFEGELLRSDFGATFGLPFIADRVRLVVQVEGQRH